MNVSIRNNKKCFNLIGDCSKFDGDAQTDCPAVEAPTEKLIALYGLPSLQKYFENKLQKLLNQD